MKKIMLMVVICMIVLTGCRNEKNVDSLNDVLVEDEVNIEKMKSDNNIVLQTGDEDLNVKKDGKNNFTERYNKAINFSDYDKLLNDVYKYLKENMEPKEFDKLKKDEIEWVKLKEKAISDYINYEGYWEDDDGESVNTQFTRERCDYLISLSKTLKYSSIFI